MLYLNLALIRFNILLVYNNLNISSKSEMSSSLNVTTNNALSSQKFQKSFIFNFAKKNKAKSHNSGFWNYKQQFRYIQFLQSNIEIMSFGFLRVQYSIFTKMSKYIKTRTTAQCKSHHQKMLLKAHGHLSNIIKYYNKKIYPKLANSGLLMDLEQKLSNIQQKTEQKPTQIGVPQSFYQIQVRDCHIKIVIDDKFIESY